MTETKVAEHVGKTYSYFHNALRAMQGGSLYHFMMVFGMNRPESTAWEAGTLTTRPSRRGTQ